MSWRPIVQRWVISPDGDILPGTPWLKTDLKGEKDMSVRHNIGFVLGGTSRVEMIITGNGVTKVVQLHDGTTVGADDLFAQQFIIPPGFSYNLTHDTGTQNPACIISKEVAD